MTTLHSPSQPIYPILPYHHSSRPSTTRHPVSAPITLHYHPSLGKATQSEKHCKYMRGEGKLSRVAQILQTPYYIKYLNLTEQAKESQGPFINAGGSYRCGRLADLEPQNNSITLSGRVRSAGNLVLAVCLLSGKLRNET
ncbi:hypothetical protein E2C01_029295 [Portunus trituberculatus]|uniref:Uncharacterized protein n=1 Tax=Portunus trituberculatus TaxID=210409 RepID=A0A5B7ERF7_PORTR|nr:hypothetical protein [Portunus trituberculatus]